MYYKFYQNSIGHPSYDDCTGQTALEHYDVLNGGKISNSSPEHYIQMLYNFSVQISVKFTFGTLPDLEQPHQTKGTIYSSKHAWYARTSPSASWCLMSWEPSGEWPHSRLCKHDVVCCSLANLPGRSCVVCIVAVGRATVYTKRWASCVMLAWRACELYGSRPGNIWWHSSLLEKCETMILGVFTQMYNS